MRETINNLAALTAVLVLLLSTPFTAAASPKQSTEAIPIPQTTDPPYDEFPADEGTTPTETTPAVGETTNLEQKSPAQEPEVAALLAPTITVWDSGNLNFGVYGNPQPKININGNVSDVGNVSSLTYSLEGGSPVAIPYNPANSSPRLVRPGDFTIEIPTSMLPTTKRYTVVITARNSGGSVVDTETVFFNYTTNNTWPIPYSTNWANAQSVYSQAQVVDGYWELVKSGSVQGVKTRSQYTGYDRLIAIGDMNWSNYEVEVPVTVWATNGSGGIGIIANWKGHTGTGQLPDDWHVMGAYGYYSFRSDTNRLAMWLNSSSSDRRIATTNAFQMQVGKTYIIKLRAEKVSGGGRYSLKAWEQGTTEPPYDAPQFAGVYNVLDTKNDQTEGSILLNAHLVDATFGNVTITPLNAPPPANLDNKYFIPAVRR